MRFLIYLSLLLTGFNGQLAFATDTPLHVPEGEVVLTVSGAISNTNAGNKAHFDWQMLEALPVHQLSTDTSVTTGIHQFTGFLLSDLFEKVGATGKQVTAIALNDYEVTIAMEEFKRFQVIAAYRSEEHTSELQS